VKAAENRNFQDPSKTTFLGRNSSGKKNRKKRKSSGILAGTGFWGPKNRIPENRSRQPSVWLYHPMKHIQGFT